MTIGDSIFPGLAGQESGEATLLANLFRPPEPPPLPESLTPQALREAIAGVLAGVSANELADECVRFGLESPVSDRDDPWKGKWRYVERRIRHWKLPELLDLARAVAAVYDDRVLGHLLTLAGVRGVRGAMKNLIFAANGPKPKIVLSDAVNNDLKIVENAEHCLVYDRPLAETGLSWRELTAWWADSDNLTGDEERAAALSLYRRLLESMALNSAEQFIFARYCACYRAHGFGIPALIPQVYLHYDPYTRRTGATLTRQRMDFLLLLPQRRRVVIELDGIQHYANDKGHADPARYAQMAAGDRELRLAGYEVYRFGGHEIADRRRAVELLEKFFADLLALPPVPDSGSPGSGQTETP
jgi:very-short-patch-repair endonuclease